MWDHFLELNFFHSFRIPVEKVDLVRFLVEKESSINNYDYLEDAAILDVAVGGIGLMSADHLAIGQELRFSIHFKKMIIEVEGQVVRSLISEEEGKIIYGVALEEKREMASFLRKYVASLPPERLKDCLESLSLQNRRSRGVGPEIFSLLVSLFRGLGALASKKDTAPAIFQEAALILEAEKVGVFLIHPQSNELRALESLGMGDEELQCYFKEGIVGSVFTSGAPVNLEKSSELDKMDSLIREKGVRSVICYPIQNAKDKVIGVIQAMNKKRGGRFQRDDEEVMHILSVIFGVIFDQYHPFSKNSKVRSFCPSFDRELVLIGRSKVIKNLRKIIINLKDTDVPLLIRGERGVGKSLFGQDYPY